MTFARLTTRTFLQDLGRQFNLLLGVALASAILTGSLAVGDSVRATLRQQATARLGNISAGAFGGDRFFEQSLAERIRPELSAGASLSALLATEGTVTAVSSNIRLNRAQVLGVDDSFWQLSDAGNPLPDAAGLGINQTLARRLGVKIGDFLLLRMELPGVLSRDAPLSGETQEEVTLRRPVTAIVDDDRLGSFSTRAEPGGEMNVFVPLSVLQGLLQKDGQCNSLLATKLSAQELSRLADAKARLADVGLRLAQPPEKPVEGAAADTKRWELSTSRVFLEEETIAAAQRVFPQAQGVLTYLVTQIQSAKGATPYSMVTATNAMTQADSSAGGVWLHPWLAEDQQLKPGDPVTLKYFVVGAARELKQAETTLKVEGILPADHPGLNASWTPSFPGVSEVENCRDWKPGIPVDTAAIRDKDEQYWDQYKGTPKAFISLAAGAKAWSNRFGSMTALRFDSALAEAEIAASLGKEIRFTTSGYQVRDLAGESAQAAQGSMDLGQLFVSMSFFLLIAALILVALLFRFTVEQRAAQSGLLLALGWTRGQVSRLWLGEAVLLVLVGAALGVAFGVLFTKAALWGLNTLWRDAAGGLPVVYAATPATLFGGAMAAAVVSFITMMLTLRALFRLSPVQLLAGRLAREESGPLATGARAGFPWIGLLALLGAIALGLSAGRLQGEAKAGAFFGLGALLLIAGISALRQILRRGRGAATAPENMLALGLRNLRRRPGRSLAVAGLMAAGVFMVTAVNAFRQGREAEPTRRSSGTGGFTLIGESSLPVYDNLNLKAGREVFGLTDEDLANVSVVPLRVRDGEDASCLNLNKAPQPLLLGVDPAAMASRGSFAFASTLEKTDQPWTLLEKADAEAVPVFADANTAQYAMVVKLGDFLDIPNGKGGTFRGRLAGLLANSMLQGRLIISEAHFIRQFPQAAGYRAFLIDAPPGRVQPVAALLSKQLAGRGLALEPSEERLGRYQAVQNSYIGMFSVLGGLGVLLATVGLGVLVARNVLERRGELGLMRAVGFRLQQLHRLLLSEHVWLHLAGVLLGGIAALAVISPDLMARSGSVPWTTLLWIIGGILAAGLLVVWLATRLALRGRLLDAVRSE